MKGSRIRILAGLALLVALLVAARPAQAASPITITVTTTLDGDDPTPGDSVCDSTLTSPAAGKCSLRAALDMASVQPSGLPVTIEVPAAKQHYLLTLGGLNLEGNGPITIDGAQRTGVVIDGGGASGVTDFIIFTDMVLRNLTITGGNNPSLGGVGGVNVGGGNVTLTNVRVTGNTGFLAGGVLQAGISNLTITNAEFDHNRSTPTFLCFSSCSVARGAGLNLSGLGNTTLAYDAILDNVSDGFGGGIYVNNALGFQIRGSNLVIAGNSSQLNGGGIDLEASYGSAPQMVLNNSVVENNISQNPATDANTDGGGIFNDSYLQLNNTRVDHNSVGWPQFGLGFGGGISNGTNGTFGTLVMTGGSISGNTAGNFGGGLDNEFIATLNGVPVTGNHAGDQVDRLGGLTSGGRGQGGGIFSANFSTLHLQGGSVSGNDAGNLGGGLSVNTHDLEIDGSTISGNVAGGASGCFGMGGGLYLNPLSDTPPTQTVPHPGIHGANVNSNTAQDSTQPLLTCNFSPFAACSAAGGGISITFGSLIVDGATHVDANRSCDGAGIDLSTAGGLTFSGVLALNVASGQGGALYASAGSLGATISGSRISGNRAAQTGGIYNLAPVTISTSIVMGNIGASGCANVLTPCL